MAFSTALERDTSRPPAASTAPTTSSPVGDNPAWSRVATGVENATPENIARATADAGVGGMDAGVADAGVADAGVGSVDAGVPAGVGPPLPSGPNACSTNEEENRKNAFRLRAFSQTPYRPSIGFGLFDAYYWPIMSLMTVIAKMKLNFVQADNTPPPAMLAMMFFTGQDITRFFWTDAEKEAFKRDYAQRVMSRWSFQHTFESTKPCWPFTARPLIMPQIIDSATDAHYQITVHKSPGPGIDYSSGINDPTLTGTRWQGTGDLYQSDVQNEPDFNSTDVANSERTRLERAVASALPTPVTFASNDATVSAADTARLQTLAGIMKAKNPSDPLIPVQLNGFASSEGRRSSNMTLSRDRADAVAAILRAEGVPQPLVVNPRGPIGAPNNAANRKVEIVPDTAFENTYSSNNYSVAEHEFGHVLGLPDEYMNNTTGLWGTQQATFVTLAQAAGVAPPDQWGVHTSSVMSAGVDVLPRHYVNLREALGAMTDPDIPLTNWAIR